MTACRVVLGHYERLLKRGPGIQAVIDDAGVFSSASSLGLGYCDNGIARAIANRLHDSQGTRLMKQELRDAGILLPNYPLRERFAGCLVLPLYDQTDNLVHIYGYRIHKGYHQWRHRWLSRNHQGIFNVKHLRSQPISDVIVCDNIIDALTFWSYGFKNVTATLGSDTYKGLTREIFNFILSRRVGTIYLAFRNTKTNQQAAIKIHQKFHRLAQVLHVTFPKNMGANDFVRNSPAPLDGMCKLMASATWLREAA